MPETFRASFELNAADFAALQKAHAERSVLTKYSAVWILLGLAAFAWFTTPKDGSPLFMMAGYSAVWLFLVFVVFPMQRYWQFMSMRPSFATSIEATDDHLKCSGSAFEHTYDWPSVDHITEYKDLIFLWIASDKAMVIPKRGFSDPAAAERFVELVKQKVTHAS